MRCNKHYHVIDLPNGRKIRTRKDCNLGDDEELGFSLGKFLKKAFKGISKIAKPIMTGGGAAVGGVFGGPQGAMIGGQLGGTLGGAVEKAGKGKKKPSKDDSEPDSSPTKPLPRGMTPGEVPTSYVQPQITKEDIKQQLIEVLSHVYNSQHEQEQTAKDIAGHVTPSLDKIINVLAQRKLQEQATMEHKKINRDNSRWQENKNNQNRILARIAGLEAKISAKQKANATVAAAFGIPEKHL